MPHIKGKPLPKCVAIPEAFNDMALQAIRFDELPLEESQLIPTKPPSKFPSSESHEFWQLPPIMPQSTAPESAGRPSVPIQVDAENHRENDSVAALLGDLRLGEPLS